MQMAPCSAKKSCLFLFFALTIAKTSQAYFGLSSKEPISDILLNPSTFRSMARLPSVSNRELCVSFHLHQRQRRNCQKESGVASTLFDAIQLSAAECQRQFQYSRWNCSLDSSRINLLEKEFKETSLLYAISSAGLVHSFSKACSSGLLTQCTCDESLNDDENRKTWLWGGCGDNLAFGQKFARRFLHRKKHKIKDLRALVDHHNSEVGIRAVREFVTKKCKCHGVSGTCTTKTCWKQLASFGEIGKNLKSKYENAVEGNANHNQAYSSASPNAPERRLSRRGLGRQKKKKKKKRHKSHRNNVINQNKKKNKKKRKKKKKGQMSAVDFGAKPRELVYLERSPDFCEKSKYSPGTSGRTCVKGPNCEELCCGRGHNVQLRNVTESCKCQVIWCCTVQCQTCTSIEEIYTCK